MTFKKIGGTWKMTTDNAYASIHKFSGAWSHSYYLDVVRNGDTVVSNKQFYNLNEAKRFAKETI